MTPLDTLNFIRERLIPVTTLPGSSRSEGDDEDQLIIDPIPCPTFEDLCAYYFADDALEPTAEIRATMATISAVILSTSTLGGQLALRVIGPPGSVKSTLAECFSAATEMVYARSKFTGIVSGWSSIKKSKNLAAKMNGKCLFIKDADTMAQLPNLPQVESELRDALGDAVIRAEYRTGRDFELYTVFTLIMCGTGVLRQMDDSTLGARYLNIYIHDAQTDTSRIVKRAINSAISGICSQLSGGVKDIDPNKVVRKPMIMKLAPPTVGFLYHKRDHIRRGINTDNALSSSQKIQLEAMADFISYMRAKVRRDRDGNLVSEAEREIGSRLGELLSRLVLFLGVVLQDTTKPLKIGKEEFDIARRVLLNTCDPNVLKITKFLYASKQGESIQDVALHINYSPAHTHTILNDMREFGIVDFNKVPNTKGRGRNLQLWTLNPIVHSLATTIKLGV